MDTTVVSPYLGVPFVLVLVPVNPLESRRIVDLLTAIAIIL